MNAKDIVSKNNIVLKYLSVFLNDFSKTISKDQINAVIECGVDNRYAYTLLLASLFKLNINENASDKLLFDEYFLDMITLENKEEYVNNPYYKNIIIRNIKYKNWNLKIDKYVPYQAFVRNDMIKYPNGKIIPQIGYFTEIFKYPAIYENNRLWMSITPNEINTMKKDIDDTFGNVLSFGLGMGYYHYMISLKENVKKITIIERDKTVIDLFNEKILPFFEYKNKINIINDDAFNYLNNNLKLDYDFIYSDLWHDVSDGLPLYKKLKKYEIINPKIVWRYWIEKTLLCY